MTAESSLRETHDEQDRLVRVLDHDPELGAHLGSEAQAMAGRHLVARSLVLEPGDWSEPWPGGEDTPGSLGLLLLDGLIMRTQQIGPAVAAELLGSGDLLRPWQTGDEGSSIRSDAHWQVIQHSRVAVLDRRFAQIAGRWPALMAALTERSVQRARLLAFQMGVSHLRRIDSRLLLLLWRLADRWGRVTPGGVVLPLRLTHGWLANLIGAQRPSVTTALGQLSHAGRIERLADGSWLLKGPAPDVEEPPFELPADAPAG
jgi:CRP/FNR family cyclic AMP-dependent transcriptional regulator